MAQPILVPLDGSKESESSLDYVKVIAPKLEAGVELLRCFEPPAAVYSLPQLAQLGEDVLSDLRLQQMVGEYLEQKQSELAPLAVDIRAECGDAAEIILDRAAQARMVVMSRHGRGGKRWLLGGVASKVVRAAKCPVLVVPGSSSQTRRDFETIMVCLDGSEASERALEKAIEVARSSGGKLLLYRFVRMVYDAETLQLDLEDARKSIAQHAEAHQDVVKDTLVRRTEGRSDIVECAAELAADLIVLGSHGHRGVARLLLGSVAEDVIHHADRPVLVVH